MTKGEIRRLKRSRALRGQKYAFVEISNFNNTHPEMKKGEAFYGNVSEENIHLVEKWKTARFGEKAYTRKGEFFPNRFPVFISREELQAARKNPNDPWGANTLKVPLR